VNQLIAPALSLWLAAQVALLPHSSDFVVTGDFDADGQIDVAVASAGTYTITVQPGNGGPEVTIEVPGAITGMIAGDVNRRDGLPDIIVSTSNGDVLVFEGPNGAMRAEPEVHAVSGGVLEMRVADVDSDHLVDLEIRTAADLTVVHGRDRRLSQDAIRRAEVQPARVARSPARSTLKPAVAGLPPIANTITVTNTFDNGIGSLRDAIVQSNGFAGLDLIRFDIPGSGVRTITLATPLPDITDGVVIDGYTQPGARPNSLPRGNNALLLVEVNANNTANPLRVLGGATTIRGLVVNRALASAIVLRGPGGHVVAGNFLGTSADGATELPNGGIRIESPDNRIGGALPEDRNVIVSLFSYVIETTTPAAHSNTIQGNYLACDRTGTRPLGQAGVRIGSANNLIGGTLPGAGNVSSNERNNAFILELEAAAQNTVQGNLVGVTANGDAPLGNGVGGVAINYASNNLIGGTTPAARNVIVAASGPVRIFGGASTQNVVQGNFIGTDASGMIVLPAGGSAGSCVHIDSGSNNTIGGAVAGAGNVIAGCLAGVAVQTQFPVARGNVIQGNLIGTDVRGAAALPNRAGVSISATSGAPGRSLGTVVGGVEAAARNVISGNTEEGVRLAGADATLIQRNLIGVAADGVGALPNQRHGISIAPGSDNVIEENVIAFNGPSFFVYDGVSIILGQRNTIRRNSIYANEQLGIDLGDNGATPSDLQNAPVVARANVSNGTTTVAGTLQSTPGTAFTVDFFTNAACDPSGSGEGQTWIASRDVMTDGAGQAAFTFGFPVATPVGRIITATATAAQGGTSEFSPCAATIACSFAIAPVAASIASAGGAGTVSVTTSSACDWISGSNVPWITISSGAIGAGDGAVAYNVAPNDGAEHSGTLTVAGQTFVVTQQAFSLATMTTLTVSPNPAVVGREVLFRARVASSEGNVQAGTVAFKVNGSLVATSAVSEGFGQYFTTTLPLGSHEIVAEYLGAPGFRASTSQAIALSVVGPSVSIEISESIRVFDQPIVMPSAFIQVSESITVFDQPTVLNTGVGTDVITAIFQGSAKPSVVLKFTQVTQSGSSVLQVSNQCPIPPPRFAPGDPCRGLDISTTAVYTGPITVTLDYSGATYRNESALRLFHFESNAWVDRTTSLDTSARTITGIVSSLSPFAIFEPANAAPIATCRNIVKPADQTCGATATVAEINNGSVDPDGDPLTFSLSNAGPYPLGTTTVTLTARDPAGNSASCPATVTVVDQWAPRATASFDVVKANKSQGTFRIAYTSSDNCDAAPATKAVMEIPAGVASYRITFERDAEPKITFRPKDSLIQLHGSDEASMRALLQTVLVDGGVAVTRGQQLDLHLDNSADKHTQFKFKGGVLADVKSPHLRLRVDARDASGNSFSATAQPPFASK
jgi:hypothetical protein